MFAPGTGAHIEVIVTIFDLIQKAKHMSTQVKFQNNGQKTRVDGYATQLGTKKPLTKLAEGYNCITRLYFHALDHD